MAEKTWTEAETAHAQQIWAAYQQQHDVSDRVGQAAGIDPASGRVWFGESAKAIALQRQAEGIDAPFFCVRVGFDHYYRKGGHR
jgi:hypothetical protein